MVIFFISTQNFSDPFQMLISLVNFKAPRSNSLIWIIFSYIFSAICRKKLTLLNFNIIAFKTDEQLLTFNNFYFFVQRKKNVIKIPNIHLNLILWFNASENVGIQYGKYRSEEKRMKCKCK